MPFDPVLPPTSLAWRRHRPRLVVPEFGSDASGPRVRVDAWAHWVVAKFVSHDPAYSPCWWDFHDRWQAIQFVAILS